jgi:gluconolactonase
MQPLGMNSRKAQESSAMSSEITFTHAAAKGVSFPFEPSQRYPDPRIEILHPSFAAYRLYSSTVEQLASGMRWTEGPVWFGDGRYLLVSDIPCNRVMRYDEATGAWGEFRSPSNMANGHCRDTQGRLVSCEHGTRRITRTEYDGRITVLASHYQGKRLNSPNDIVCRSDGSIWFTDPPFGIHGDWEGQRAVAELPHAVYRIDSNGELAQVLTDVPGPNGLAFSPDEQILYVVESRAQPSRLVVAYDVSSESTLSNRRVVIDAQGAGALDGIAIDADGNIWCGWGSDGRAGVSSEGLDGVRVFNPQGLAIGHIHLPERCANLCFGGARGNRLFMAAGHSLYAVYVNTRGAGFQ